MATFFGWYRTHGNRTKAHAVELDAGFATGDGRFDTYGFLLITREDGAKCTIRIPPEAFARLAAQMASAQLASEREPTQ